MKDLAYDFLMGTLFMTGAIIYSVFLALEERFSVGYIVLSYTGVVVGSLAGIYFYNKFFEAFWKKQ